MGFFSKKQELPKNAQEAQAHEDWESMGTVYKLVCGNCGSRHDIDHIEGYCGNCSCLLSKDKTWVVVYESFQRKTDLETKDYEVDKSAELYHLWEERKQAQKKEKSFYVCSGHPECDYSSTEYTQARCPRCGKYMDNDAGNKLKQSAEREKKKEAPFSEDQKQKRLEEDFFAEAEKAAKIAKPKEEGEKSSEQVAPPDEMKSKDLSALVLPDEKDESFTDQSLAEEIPESPVIVLEELPAEPEQIPREAESTSEQTVSKPDPAPDKVYRCKSCSEVFASTEDFIMGKCPKCGSEIVDVPITYQAPDDDEDAMEEADATLAEIGQETDDEADMTDEKYETPSISTRVNLKPQSSCKEKVEDQESEQVVAEPEEAEDFREELEEEAGYQDEIAWAERMKSSLRQDRRVATYSDEGLERILLALKGNQELRINTQEEALAKEREQLEFIISVLRSLDMQADPGEIIAQVEASNREMVEQINDPPSEKTTGLINPMAQEEETEQEEDKSAQVVVLFPTWLAVAMLAVAIFLVLYSNGVVDLPQEWDERMEVAKYLATNVASAIVNAFGFLISKLI